MGDRDDARAGARELDPQATASVRLGGEPVTPFGDGRERDQREILQGMSRSHGSSLLPPVPSPVQPRTRTFSGSTSTSGASAAATGSPSTSTSTGASSAIPAGRYA